MQIYKIVFLYFDLDVIVVILYYSWKKFIKNKRN